MGEFKSEGPLTETIYYILLALHQPMHGYGIMQRVEEMTEKRVVLGPGTLYGAINNMLKKGWIENIGKVSARGKKEYQVTSLGREIAKNELLRLKILVGHGERIVEEKGN